MTINIQPQFLALSLKDWNLESLIFTFHPWYQRSSQVKWCYWSLFWGELISKTNGMKVEFFDMFPQSYSLQGRRKSFRKVSNPSWNSELINTKYLTLTRRYWRCDQKPGQLLKTNESMLRLIKIQHFDHPTKTGKTHNLNLQKKENCSQLVPHPTLWALFDPPKKGPWKGLPATVSLPGTWNLPCTYFRCAFLTSTLLALHFSLVGWRWGKFCFQEQFKWWILTPSQIESDFQGLSEIMLKIFKQRAVVGLHPHQIPRLFLGKDLTLRSSI